MQKQCSASAQQHAQHAFFTQYAQPERQPDAEPAFYTKSELQHAIDAQHAVTTEQLAAFIELPITALIQRIQPIFR